MDTAQPEAQLRQAQAEERRAEIGVHTASALVRQRQAEERAADAVVAQRRADNDAAQRQLARSEPLARRNAISQSVLDNDRAAADAAQAALAAAEAQLAAAEASISAAQASVIDAGAAVDAAAAAIERSRSASTIPPCGRRATAACRTASPSRARSSPPGAGAMPQFGLLIMLILMPLQLLSGAMTPRESMPDLVRWLMLAAPNTHFVILAQAILFRGAGLPVVWPQLAALLAISGLCFSLALTGFRRFLR